MANEYYNPRALKDFLKNYGEAVVYDLETTGLSPASDRAIQVAARKVKVLAGHLEEEGMESWYINPGFAVGPKIVELTGINNVFLKNKPREKEAFPEIEEYFGGLPVIGYNNSKFDDRFMANMYARYGKEFAPAYSLDAFALCKGLVTAKEAPNYKLGTMAEHFGHKEEIGRFHNAEGDTLATLLVTNDCIRLAGAEDGARHLTKCRVLRIRYWEHKDNWKVKRIYVDTDITEFYFDTIRKTWHTKNDDDFISRYDMEHVERQALAATRSRSIDEFAGFRGSIRRGC